MIQAAVKKEQEKTKQAQEAHKEMYTVADKMFSELVLYAKEIDWLHKRVDPNSFKGDEIERKSQLDRYDNYHKVIVPIINNNLNGYKKKLNKSLKRQQQ